MPVVIGGDGEVLRAWHYAGGMAIPAYLGQIQAYFITA